MSTFAGTLATALLLLASTAVTAAPITSRTNDDAWGYYPTPAFTLAPGAGVYLPQDKWATRFPFCGGTDATGRRSDGNLQSPIDLAQVPVDLDLRPLNMRTYLPFTAITITAVPQKQLRITPTAADDSYTRDPKTGIQYVLKHIDVRSPSEHTFGGARRDLELQFIHTAAPSEGISEADPRFTFAISATYMVGEGSKSGFLDSLFVVTIPYLEKKQQEGRVAFNYTVSRTGAIADMPPISRDYFRYDGSMTYPPCAENVIWNLYANPLYMSRSQLQQIRALMGLPDVEEESIYNLSGATGSGDPGLFDVAVGNSRSLSFVPESLQPLLDATNIYSEQKYATTYLSNRRRLFTQTEIRGVTMFKEYVGDAWLNHKVEALPANDVARQLGIAAICCACAGLVLAVLAFMIQRA